jgi:hypothetical protein
MSKIRAHAFYKSINNIRPDNLVIASLGDFYGLNKRWRIFFLIDSILFYTNKYSVYNLVFDRI